MSDKQTTVTAHSIAVKWLMYELGMTAEQAAETMSNVTVHAWYDGATRQEALDIAAFVIHIMEVENDQ